MDCVVVFFAKRVTTGIHLVKVAIARLWTQGEHCALGYKVPVDHVATCKHCRKH